jgi:bis(5'-nucleosyl)-tetraphosphatase (symmetrical)
MATYAIGDVQGCYQALRRLLALIHFDRARDTLWFVGDLVNRGPDSLAVLRFVRGLGDAAVSVLGNHDLHLLCVAAGVQPHRPPKVADLSSRRHDTLEAILQASDRDELLVWLRHRPLMHVEHGYALVHAGLLPNWTIDKAVSLAKESQISLSGPHYLEFLSAMYGNEPDRWDDALTGWERLRVVVNAMTRMRICTPDGRMQFAHKGTLAEVPAGFMPWYAAPSARSGEHTVLFGHWSAHGFARLPGAVALDSGCVWGGALSALRLEDRLVFQVGCS